MIVLQNLTTTLSQLAEASQAQTVALADVKEDLLLQEADEPNLERPAELSNIAQLKAVLNDCAIQAEKTWPLTVVATRSLRARTTS